MKPPNTVLGVQKKFSIREVSGTPLSWTSIRSYLCESEYHRRMDKTAQIQLRGPPSTFSKPGEKKISAATIIKRNLSFFGQSGSISMDVAKMNGKSKLTTENLS